jgi:hypothetical protein
MPQHTLGDIASARDISDRAVRRKSCKTQRGIALRPSRARSSLIFRSSSAFDLENPEKARRPPFVEKINFFRTGPISCRVALDSGTTFSTLVLKRVAGIV